MAQVFLAQVFLAQVFLAQVFLAQVFLAQVFLAQVFLAQVFLAQVFLARGARCGLNQEVQRTLFPSALVGEGGSRRRQVYAVCASLTARDSEREPGQGLFR
jgi:hypothetical protein